ncbi:uncharacterized protein J3D65DRAFT_615579 [Phyllosticta citribraziliensis]|uniref:Uncharacterized protein n=1 Tax=Phyllosticta citribraziliensis TaxID=989973 RepID=A0ABR1LZ96_9PEZI
MRPSTINLNLVLLPIFFILITRTHPLPPSLRLNHKTQSEPQSPTTPQTKSAPHQFFPSSSAPRVPTTSYHIR